MLSFSVHLQSTDSSSPVHCSCSLNARECTPQLDTGGCRANEAQGRRSQMAVGVPGSHHDVQTLLRSGTARSVRPLLAGLCSDRLGGRKPLHTSTLLGTGRGAPCRFPPAGHERGPSHPRESESRLRTEPGFGGPKPKDSGNACSDISPIPRYTRTHSTLLSTSSFPPRRRQTSEVRSTLK